MPWPERDPIDPLGDLMEAKKYFLGQKGIPLIPLEPPTRALHVPWGLSVEQTRLSVEQCARRPGRRPPLEPPMRALPPTTVTKRPVFAG